jgi:hypothetical protein
MWYVSISGAGILRAAPIFGHSRHTISPLSLANTGVFRGPVRQNADN